MVTSAGGPHDATSSAASEPPGYPAGSSAAPSERIDGCAPHEGIACRTMSRCIQQYGDPAEVQASFEDSLPQPSEYIQK